MKETNCKNCGAPIDLKASKCAYCGTPYQADDDCEEVTLYCDGKAILTLFNNIGLPNIMTPNEIRAAQRLKPIN